MSKSSQHIRRTYFGSTTVTNTYAAMGTDDAVIEFMLINDTTKVLNVRVGASGDTIQLANGKEIILKGNPADYQIANGTDTNSITVKRVLYAI